MREPLKFRSWVWRDKSGYYEDKPYSKTGGYDHEHVTDTYATTDFPVQLYPDNDHMPTRRVVIPIWPRADRVTRGKGEKT